NEGVEVFELGGISANPRLYDCKKGSLICKENNIDMVIGLGGGSVLDTAKAVAVGALDGGELWDFFEGKREVEKALPVIAIMTIAATGSEYDSISVVKNEKLNKKF